MQGNRLKTFVVCAGVVLAFFLLLEGASRLYLSLLAPCPGNAGHSKQDFMDLQNFQGGQYAQKDDLLGYRLVENRKVGEYSFNSLGFRGRDFTQTKPEGTIRVICIGGSTTIGSNAGGDQFSYPWLLEELLRKAFPKAKNIEVINAGVFGYHSWHSLLRVENEFDRYDPDVYVFMDGLNDVMAAYGMDKNQLEHIGNGSAALTQLVDKNQENFARRASEFLRVSALFSIMERAIKALQFRLESMNFAWEMTEKMRLFGYKRNVEEAISHALARNKGVILLNYPWIVDGQSQGEEASRRLPYKIDPGLIKLYNFGRAYLPQVNADIAGKLGVPYVDLQGIFDRQVREGGIKRLFSDNIHFTRYGNYELAKAVCRELGGVKAFTRLAGPAVDRGDWDSLFPELATWYPSDPEKACLAHDLVGWFGRCSQEDRIRVSGLDDNEVDTLGSWRWAFGEKVVLSFNEAARRRLRVEFAFCNPIPGQGLTILANGKTVYHAQDIPVQKWLVEKTEGSFEMTTEEGENRVELVFAKGNHLGYDFAPNDNRKLNAALLHFIVQNQ
jgi:lysophospholipase L1-like esterase